MPLLVGVLLALAVGGLTTATGLDRDRALYPVVTLVVASYYLLFAVMAGSMPALGVESIGGAVFLALAVAGFRRSLWLVVAALAGHGVFDIVHEALIANPGVPAWWPGFCMAYDVTAALYLAWLIRSGRLPAAIRTERRPA
jgi:hypothetical protein